ncbi:MAG: CHAT domain-containing tetratricopeptide repeat protein [Bacteroidota bacterium]
MKTIGLTLGIWLLLAGVLFGQQADTIWTKSVYARFESAMYEGDFNKAALVCKTALDTANTRYGAASAEAGSLLEYIFYAQIYAADFETALKTAQSCYEIRRTLFGEQHLETANALGHVGVAQLRVGQVDAAEKSLKSSVTTMEALKETRSSEYSATLSELAELYRRQGYLLKSEALFLKSIDLEVQYYGKARYTYAIFCGNIAAVYAVMERWDDALRYTDECLKYSEKFIGKEHPDYILTLTNKGANLCSQGRYGESERILKQTLEMARKVIAPDDPEITYYLSALSALYTKTGRYDESLSMMEESARIVLNKFGELHPRYIELLNNIGRIQQSIDNLSAADSLYKRCLSLMEKSGRKESLDYAATLASSARIIQRQEKYHESGILLDSAAVIGERIVGKKTAEFYTDFGLYQAIQASFENRWDDALKILDEARPYMIENYGIYHERYINLEALYGSMWQGKGNAKEALKHFSIAFHTIQTIFNENFKYLSISEREKFARIFEYYQSLFYALARYNPDRAEVQCFAYDLTLFRKELLTGYDRQLMNTQAADADSLSARYRVVSQMIAKQQTLPVKQRVELTELEKQRNELEKQLAGRSNPVINIARWKQVQEKLKPGEAAVEWLLLAGKNNQPDYYGALILQSGWDAPKLVVLQQVKTIDSLFAANGSRGLQYATRTYGNTALYSAIWKPLEPALKQVKRIFYAPSGALHLLNFDAFLLPDGSNLADHYELVRLSSTARLLEPDFQQPIRFEQPALLVGGLDYNESDMAAVTEPGSNHFESGLRGLLGTSWPTLPQTKVEVDHIESIMQARKRPYTLLSGKTGTETALKQACEKPIAPSMVHIATHGFFYERKKTSTSGGLGLVTAENPMFRTGLIMAGANSALQGANANTDPDDGILTADEISLFNLKGTGLVTLSACETALGDVSAYEGVYGLQRAIRLTGAQRMITSIWKVPDAQTRAFMDVFYQQLMDKNDVHAAFSAAQNAMRKQFQTPYYWAGFILIE